MPGEFRVRQTTRHEVRDCPPCPAPPKCSCSSGGSSDTPAGCGIAIAVVLVIAGLITGWCRLSQDSWSAEHTSGWTWVVVFLGAAFLVGIVAVVILEKAKEG